MDGYNFYQTPPTPPTEPKKDSIAKKFFLLLAAAIVFGMVAAGTFVGVSNLINRVSPIAVTTSSSENNTNVATQTSSNGTIQATTTVSSNKIEGTSVSEIAENSMPFTVAVNCTFTSSSWFGAYTSEGSGTGIIVKENETELLIVTNNHVIDSAKTISVVFVDGTKVSAVAKGTNSKADLAVIAVKLADISEETKNSISFATLGNSNDVKVGEMVVAIGNALGYGQSVTVGYISAKDREVTVDGNTMTLLQTDAAINPGNSGGALINMKGEVIGINSVKYADENVEGMGFAIPVSNVTEIIEDLMNQLSADEKGYIGIYITEVTEEIADYYNWPRGIYVRSFTENSAAAEAGIQVGDIITAVNGSEVLTSEDLVNKVTAHKYGTQIEVTLKRKVDGEWTEFKYTVTLSQSSDYATPSEDKTEQQRPQKRQ